MKEHIESDFYNLSAFLDGQNSLNEIELNLLGDVNGKSILHLQCHFGQDSISLSRMGAEVVGIDFSEQSITKATEIANNLNTSTKFVCSDVYDLPNNLKQTFDIVYTSYGTITWLPDLNKWANVISHFLKPGGKFIFAEFHPVVWMFDDDLKNIKYHYNNVNPIIEVEEGSYANPDADINKECITWNHGIGEVISALIKQGLAIESFQEYDYAPYPFVKNTAEFEPKKFRIEHFGNKIPLVYSISAIKK